MSSMIPTPPPSIQIGGGPGGPSGPESEGPNDADKGNVSALLKKALALVDQAAQAEGDDIDAAQIRNIAATIQKQIAAELQLQDQVMGGGPGAKMVRKATPAPGGPTGA